MSKYGSTGRLERLWIDVGACFRLGGHLRRITRSPSSLACLHVQHRYNNTDHAMLVKVACATVRENLVAAAIILLIGGLGTPLSFLQFGAVG